MLKKQSIPAYWGIWIPLLLPDESITRWNIFGSVDTIQIFNGDRSQMYSQRIIVNVIVYMLYEGGWWRSLPNENLPWQIFLLLVSLLAQERSAEGYSSASLGVKVREELGRNDTDSVGIINTQTVKTTALLIKTLDTIEQKSKGGNAVLLPIHKDYWLEWSSYLLNQWKRLRLLGASPPTPMLQFCYIV